MSEIRSFIAVPVDEAIIAQLASLQQEFRRAEAPVGWVRPEGMHLTLKFLGNMPEAQAPALEAALRRAAAPFAPFPVRVESIGGFPNPRRPKVVRAGMREDTDTLAALAAAVDAATAALGFAPEERPFRPHLTLGRVKAPERLDRLSALLQAHADDRFGEMTVREVLLFRSDLSPRGARYTPLRRIALGAPTE